MRFRAPPTSRPGDAELDLLADMLAAGKAGRLYKALVYDRPLAQEVSAAQVSQDLSSYFSIEILARPGVALDDLEKAVDRVLTDATLRPPTAEELKRAKNRHEFRFLERLQSMAERATLLNQYEVTRGNPGYFDQDLARYQTATSATVFRWAKETLTLNDRVVLRVIPAGKKGP